MAASKPRPGWRVGRAELPIDQVAFPAKLGARNTAELATAAWAPTWPNGVVVRGAREEATEAPRSCEVECTGVEEGRAADRASPMLEPPLGATVFNVKR